ncbi:MAG: YqeG family HAD IIIA-type phosphatase [Clostridiales bacterium]|nr:YqeG family HAD IIIA-type phosphatase [Clostridiales bacterium]
MFRNLYPDIYVDSAYGIDYESLYADGYRGLIFDIDNTLVHHGAPADERAKALFNRLKNIGFKCCLISNNDEARVKMFNDSVHVTYTCKAHKPRPEGYLKAMELMGTDKETTIFIGDQIFTDIWGANNAGIPSIMVKYIYWKEEIQIFFKRWLEFFVLRFYRFYRRRHPSEARGAFFSKNICSN